MVIETLNVYYNSMFPMTKLFLFQLSAMLWLVQVSTWVHNSIFSFSYGYHVVVSKFFYIQELPVEISLYFNLTSSATNTKSHQRRKIAKVFYWLTRVLSIP